MEKTKHIFLFILCILVAHPTKAYADFWGGDLPLLAEIVITTSQQLTKLEAVLGKNEETLALLKDINRGARDAINILQTKNRTFEPGVLSDLQNAAQLLKLVEQLYGKIPNSPSAKLQGTLDASVAESIHLHNEAFRYANEIDPEAERIKEYAKDVNPLGAQKLTAQAVGVLIHVMNQILRTNAAMLKMQSEQLALQNRREKIDSEQHIMKYRSISKAFGELKANYRLPALGK